jgi:hypothetical protein
MQIPQFVAISSLVTIDEALGDEVLALKQPVEQSKPGGRSGISFTPGYSARKGNWNRFSDALRSCVVFVNLLRSHHFEIGQRLFVDT